LMAWLTALSISWRLISETMSKEESEGMGPKLRAGPGRCQARGYVAKPPNS
jgi:hypothetical protein